MKYSIVAVCFSFLLQTGNTCFAQDDKAPIAATNTATAASEIAAINMYQLSLFKQVLAKGRNQALASAAHTMLADHQRLDVQMTAYANRRNITGIEALNAQYAPSLTGWDAKAGNAGWDKAVLEELIAKHQSTIAMLEGRQVAADAQLKEIARQYIPIFKGHLDKLIPMHAAMNSGNAPVADATPSGNVTGTKEDVKFLTDMMAMNQYELLLMELVLAKGNNRDFKDAVQRMIEDHHQLADRANSFAKGRGYTINAGDRNAYAAKTAKWVSKRGGMEWDADMVEELTDVHKDGIDALQDAVKDVADAELKIMMTETITTLNAHMSVFSSLKEKVKKPWNNKK